MFTLFPRSDNTVADPGCFHLVVIIQWRIQDVFTKQCYGGEVKSVGGGGGGGGGGDLQGHM